jgi:hypothetical protein
LDFIQQEGFRDLECAARIVALWRALREEGQEDQLKSFEDRVWKGMARVNQLDKLKERNEWSVYYSRIMFKAKLIGHWWQRLVWQTFTKPIHYFLGLSTQPRAINRQTQRLSENYFENAERTLDRLPKLKSRDGSVSTRSANSSG